MLPWLCLATSFLGAPPIDPVYDVPRLEGIVVDGKVGDWKDRGFRVMTMSGIENVPATSIDGRFRIGWDAQGLVVLVGVKDDRWNESSTLDSLYAGDSVEPCSDGANATAQPADGTWQGGVGTAQPIRGGLHALRRPDSGDAVLNGVEQTRQPGGKKVR